MEKQLITISKFAKDNDKTKASYIKKNGIYLDSYFDNDYLVNVYALHDFFVEVVISIRISRIVDYIPFERGFSHMKKAKVWVDK
jgi:hypothetical protein